MRFDIFTIFPGMFAGPLGESIVARAVRAGLVAWEAHDVRSYATDRHKTTDDVPYGGGGGMVMKAEPLVRAIRSVVPDRDAPDVEVVLLTPQGQVLTQRLARELSHKRRIALICGRYEGVDERVRELVVTREVSIGDYVLSGGELAAMVLIEVVTRLLPGVLGDPGAAFEDSHADGLLEYPHYTRPAEFEGLVVPEVLLSGNHAEIVRWRRQESLRRTLLRRPDLLDRARLSQVDREYLAELRRSLD
ncbi:MAG: tRNA (guanosine(37)-N1)-methyltransferase TrmD [Anaerolineae bacterium]|nr:tRNA (guanosine(37)-N1)-methyltransferase TrmD [Anaerolineae bacterium]